MLPLPLALVPAGYGYVYDGVNGIERELEGAKKNAHDVRKGNKDLKVEGWG